MGWGAAFCAFWVSTDYVSTDLDFSKLVNKYNLQNGGECKISGTGAGDGDEKMESVLRIFRYPVSGPLLTYFVPHENDGVENRNIRKLFHDKC